MLVSSDPVAAENGGSSGAGGGGAPLDSGGSRWPRQETVALIKIRTDMDVAFRDASFKGPLWNEVSRKLAELGYNRSAKKCKEKFENVFKYHKRTKDGRATKSDGKTYRFFDQLTALDSHPPPPHHPQSHHTTATPLSIAMPPTNPSNIAPPFSTISSTQNLAQFHNQPTNQNLPHVSSSDESTSSDEEAKRPRSQKQKLEDFFRKLTRRVVVKQEEMQKKFLEALEKHEKDRLARDEVWRTRELVQMSREREILAQERAVSVAKDAALFAFLQKVSASEQNNTAPPPPQPGPVPHQLALTPPKVPTSKSPHTPPPLPLLLQQIPQLPVSGSTPVSVVSTSSLPQSQSQASRTPPPPPPQHHIPQSPVSGSTPVSNVSPPPQPPRQQQQHQIPQLPVSGATPVSSVSPSPLQPPASKSTQTPPPPQQQAPQLPISGPTPVSVFPPPPPQLQLRTPPSAQNTRNTNNDNGREKVNFNSNPSSSRWPKSEIEALIKLRTNLDIKYQENVPKGPLWEEISTGMLRLGYNRNAKRCKEKWENINKYYKKVKESNKKRPEDSKTCPYFSQLEAIYKERAKSYGNEVAPIMAQPEQQWPVLNRPLNRPQQEWPVQNRPQLLLMEGHDSDDDMDDDGEEDETGNYEMIVSKPSALSTAT